MRRSPASFSVSATLSKGFLSSAAVLALALGLVACGKSAPGPAAGGATAASSTAPIQWDLASKDPAKNPYAANKEADTAGYTP